MYADRRLKHNIDIFCVVLRFKRIEFLSLNIYALKH